MLYLKFDSLILFVTLCTSSYYDFSLCINLFKALRDLHECGHDPGVLSELRTATDLALRATKVTARSLGHAMSTMVVQERHLWLCLADMKEVDKARFLNAPVSQTGLFGDAVENFAQQFSAAQKQTEAIRHILPRRAAAASTRPPAAVPRSTRRRGRPPAAAAAAPASLQPSSAVEPAAGQPPRPSRPPPNQAASVEASGPETDDPGMEMFALREMVNAPLPPPEEGRAENLLFPFLPLASRSVVLKTSAKEQFPLSLGPQRGRGVVNESNLSYTHPPLSPVGSCGRFERAVNRTTHAPSARTQVSASHTPTPLRTGNETPEPGPCVPLSLPHRGYVSGFVGVTSTVLGGLASAPQPVSLAPPYHQTRLCDSVRPATSQVSRHPLHHSEGSGCPHLASRDRSPTGEGRDRAGPSSRYEVGVLQPLLHCTQEKRWVKTNLGSARFEPGPSQAPVQNAHTETHLWVRPSPRLVCSDRPEGRVLPRVDPSAPQAIPAVCIRRTGISVQSPALRAVPVAPCLHESSGGSPCSPERTGRAHSQLPRRLAYTSSVAGPVMRTQGHGALAPQPVGPSGQLGKEQTLPGAEDLFSRYGVRLGQSDSAPHAGTLSVGVELLEYIQEQDGGTTETVSEAPGAYGGCGGGHGRWGCSI